MAATDPTPHPDIATHSVAEGLDFACNLLAVAIGQAADKMPNAAPTLLRALAEYISYRYAGEYELGLVTLAGLARDLEGMPAVRWAQFWNQMEWVGRQMGVAIDPHGKAG